MNHHLKEVFGVLVTVKHGIPFLLSHSHFSKQVLGAKK